ncbi:MAG: hypothetical protein WKF87_06580 [Chryseolinea sp.]
MKVVIESAVNSFMVCSVEGVCIVGDFRSFQEAEFYAMVIGFRVTTIKN